LPLYMLESYAEYSNNICQQILTELIKIILLKPTSTN
jgi:hypothetical protein